MMIARNNLQNGRKNSVISNSSPKISNMCHCSPVLSHSNPLQSNSNKKSCKILNKPTLRKFSKEINTFPKTSKKRNQKKRKRKITSSSRTRKKRKSKNRCDRICILFFWIVYGMEYKKIYYTYHYFLKFWLMIVGEVWSSLDLACVYFLD